MESSRIHRSRRLALRLAAALAILALAAGACGRPDAGTAAPRAKPRRGGTLRLALPGVGTLDPLFVIDVYEAAVVAGIFSGLVRYDDDLNVLPDLAEEWRVSPDGRTYTFAIRRGVRFHDGAPLEIEDILHTFQRCLHAAGQPADLGAVLNRLIEPEYIDGRPSLRIYARDAHTLEIVLRHAYPDFLKILATDQLRVVPRRHFPLDRRVDRPPFVGAGPFVLDVFQADRIELRRNDRFYRQPPYLDRVRFILTADYSAGHIRHLFEAGQLDVLDVYAGPPDDGFMPLAQRKIQTQFTSSLMVFNCRRPPTDDPHFRKAVALAFNRPEFFRHGNPALKPNESLLPARMFGFTPPAGRYPFDPPAATMALERARSDGPDWPPLIYLDAKQDPRFRRFLDEMAGRLGLSIQSRESGWASFGEELSQEHYHIALIAWTADTPIPEQYLESLLHSRSPQNIAGYDDPVVDDLIDRLYRESDLNAKLRIIQAIENRLQDTVPLIPLESYVITWMVQPYVRGAKVNPFGICSLNLGEIWFEPTPEQAT